MLLVQFREETTHSLGDLGLTFTRSFAFMLAVALHHVQCVSSHVMLHKAQRLVFNSMVVSV